MGKWWWALLLITSSVQADAARDGCRQEIQNIDAQVQKLEVQKKKHVDLARKYQAEGDQWQYRTGRIDDAHQSWGKADDERAQAIQYQRKIDLLLEHKQHIYQFYPELQYND